jgi:ABC-type branched-subunit amino acid transport system ATPase component
MTVLENLLVAQHNALMARPATPSLGVLGLQRYRAPRPRPSSKARYWLDKIGLTSAPTIRPAICPTAPSGGSRSRAPCARPGMLCLDEPAAGLNPRERGAQDLPASIRDEHGTSILLIEHDMSVVMEIFRPRRRAGLRPQDLGRHAASRCATIQGDRRLSRRRGRRGREGGSGDRAMSEPLLAVRGVKSFYGNIMAQRRRARRARRRDRHADRRQRAGKSTLMMTICGNPRAREGSIHYRGRDITSLPTHEIARCASPSRRRARASFRA